jgi:hypothetical protein
VDTTAFSETARLKQQIKHGLDEILILITGVEILLGFQFNAVFTSGFEKLPLSDQHLQLVGLSLLLLTLMFIQSPVSYHRIAENGQDTSRFRRFLRHMTLMALPPFAISLGMDVYIVSERIGGTILAWITGVLTTLGAFIFWYIIEWNRRQADGRNRMNTPEGKANIESAEATKLSDKVDHVLTEARVVLPGAQALLGFQFISILAEGFDKLGSTSKYLHLLSLLLIALTTILLMTPAAYHRIVENGDDTEHFHRLAGRFVLAAMGTLALGIAINFYVVVNKVTGSVSLAGISTGILLILFYGFWFGYTSYCRYHKS